MIDVVVTIATTAYDDSGKPYAYTRVFRLEFEDNIKAEAWMRTGLDYSLNIEQLAATPS